MRTLKHAVKGSLDSILVEQLRFGLFELFGIRTIKLPRRGIRVLLVNEVIWAVSFVVLSDEDMHVPMLSQSIEEPRVLSGSCTTMTWV